MFHRGPEPSSMKTHSREFTRVLIPELYTLLLNVCIVSRPNDVVRFKLIAYRCFPRKKNVHFVVNFSCYFLIYIAGTLFCTVRSNDIQLRDGVVKPKSRVLQLNVVARVLQWSAACRKFTVRSVATELLFYTCRYAWYDCECYRSCFWFKESLLNQED